ncbi:barstar family protein [Streptomyces sp. BI20]|uniref:barstar family protein n=1 Tax=Streptomyces sp. BI20 TaxID=3403460 RepID=UPI003C77CB4C
MTLRRRPLGPALTEAAAHGRTVLRLDLDGVHDRAGLFERCAGALTLPAWFGANWDALADALHDLSWLPAAPGRLLAVESWRPFAQDRPQEWEVFTEILAEAEEFWRDGDQGPLDVLLVDPAPRPGPPPSARR